MGVISADFNGECADGQFDVVMRGLFGGIQVSFAGCEHPEAHVVSAPIGRCQLSVLEAGAHRVLGERVVRRSTDADAIKVVVQLRGKTHFWQSNAEHELDAGALVIYDPTRPYTFLNESAVRQVLFQAPRDLLICQAGMPSDPLQFYDAEASGLPRVLANMLSSVGAGLGHIDDNLGKQLGGTLESLVCAVSKGSKEEDAGEIIPPRILRQRIVEFVQKHLSDPDLSINSIAAALHCSKRYLHRSFEHEAMTLERYIWNARLDRSRSVLSSGRERQHSLSAIAFACGFNSSSHFSRAFKLRFGMTPREFRLLTLGADPAH